jgi:hypothetical protein
MPLSIGSPTRSISRSVMTRRTLARNRLRSARPMLASLALGCASQGVDLGGGVATQSLQRGARCEVSPILEGNVLVTNQEELEELEGCEQIVGDLTIRLFAGADLSPLRALRVVDSSLLLGQTLFAEPSDDQSFDEIEQLEATLRGTWLASLTGLESLERVGALGVFHTAVPDLTPLERLRQIGGATRQTQTSLSSGDLVILGNLALRDLSGLEQVRGATELEVGFNGALESLAGLTLGSELTLLSLYEEPALTDIDALSTVTRLGSLTLNTVGVTDLDAFSAVFQVDDAVTIEFNPNLVDATGLGNISQTRSLAFTENAMLKTLPSLQSYFVPPESVVIIDNPELEELIFDFSQASTSGFFAGGRPLSFSIDGILIRNNAKLRSVAFPPSPIEQLGVSSMQILAFELNPSLTDIDFGALASVDQLVIDQNPMLANVTLGELSTVDRLQLTSNPSLDTSDFDPVRTFERVE